MHAKTPPEPDLYLHGGDPMMPVASTAGGEAFGAPDVCLTPDPVALPAPVAYRNRSALGAATGVAPNVFIEVMPAVTLTSVLPSSTGDEAGALGGVVSKVTAGPARFTQASSKVYAAGAPVVYLGCTTAQNGSAPNLPGALVTVAQRKVFTAP
jgi:hypothetical protein